MPSVRLPNPAILPEYTTTAMEGFQCLADRCEDTCCRDWAVPIDRDDLERMKATMQSTPEGRERLIRLVVIGNPARVAGGLAQLQMNEACACPMLETDNRCGIHAAFGEQALTTPCSVFPRTALAVEDRLEVGGSLGCPEVARRVLLPEAESHLRLRPAAVPLLPRAYVGKTIPRDPTNAYAAYFTEVRAALLACFQTNLALGTQFALAADLAERLNPFFHAETTEFQGARRNFAENRLQGEIASTRSASLHAALDRDLAALSVPGEAVTNFVRAILIERQRLPHSARFARLLAEVLRQTGSPLREESAGTPPQPGADELWRIHAERRAALDARLGARLDSMFSNYCRHFLMRHPYTDAPTLLDHLYNLGIQLAAARLLTFCHPDLAARLAAEPDHDLDRATFETVVVHVVQTFTKAISHHSDYVDAAIRPSTAPGGRITFGRLVLLAKFF